MAMKSWRGQLLVALNSWNVLLAQLAGLGLAPLGCKNLFFEGNFEGAWVTYRTSDWAFHGDMVKTPT